MPAVVLAGLTGPALVLALGLAAWLALGAEWAVAVLAVGLVLVIGLHLWQLHLLTHWAASPLDEPVPEGRGAWRAAFTALHRRARSRSMQQRDLSLTIDRFRNAAEAIPDGMVLLDPGNAIRWANARALEHLGLDLAHDRGKPLTHLVRQPEIVHYLDEAEFSNAVVIESQRAPGVTLSIQVVPFGVDEKLLISRDITQLEATARMRRDFIANVSHELKTPLTVVGGFIETLQDMELEPQQQARYLGLMREQAQSMERLVADLLTLSALESEHNPLGEATFAVAPLLEEVAASSRALSDGRHTITLGISEPSLVMGSRDELGSAFENLVSNAIRYTLAGGTVALEWRIEPNGDGVFRVTDTGIGIAAEHIPRLTERFYRVDRSRSRATGGTGLGLAIVKHVLIRHQSALEIKSTPGQGSTFAVRLPAARLQSLDAGQSHGTAG